MIEHVAKDVHDKEFKDLTEAQKTEVQKYSEERYLAFLMLRNSGKEHDCLRDDLNNDYAKDNDQYTKTRHQCAYLLQKYSKKKVATRVTEEYGNSFLQTDRGGRGGRGGRGVRSNGSGNVHYNKQDLKDKTYHGCDRKGHPKWACQKQSSGEKDEVKDDNNKSSRSNRSSESNSSKLSKLKKRMKKSFTTMKTQIEELENQSYISDSDESGSMFLQVVDMRSTVLKHQHNTFLNNNK